MVPSKNDQKIINLQEKVKEEKSMLEKSKRFSPITNCTLNFESETFNLNTLSYDSLKILAIRINSYLLSSRDLCRIDYQRYKEVFISGFKLEDWIEDIQAKMDCLSVSLRKKKLNELEKKLKTLLSEDVKTKLEIDNIEKELSQ